MLFCHVAISAASTHYLVYGTKLRLCNKHAAAMVLVLTARRFLPKAFRMLCPCTPPPDSVNVLQLLLHVLYLFNLANINTKLILQRFPSGPVVLRRPAVVAQRHPPTQMGAGAKEWRGPPASFPF